MDSPRFKIKFYLAAFYFAYFAYIGVMLIYLPKTLYDLGYSAYEIGIIFGMIPLIRFFVPFVFLKHIKLTDRLFGWALFLFLLSSILFYFTIHDFTLFLLNHIFMGIVVSIIPPYVDSMALTHLKKENYGRVRLWGSVGFIIVAYVLADYVNNYLYVIHYLVAMVAFSGIFAGMLLRIEHFSPKEDSTVSEKSTFRLSTHWAFWVSIFLMQVGFGGFYNFFTIYEAEQGFSIDLIKYMWIFGVVCEVAMLTWQSGILKQYSLLILVKFTVLMSVFRWLILYLFPEVAAMSFLSQSFHALSFALYHTAVISYLHMVYKDKKLAQQFFSGFSYGLGMFVGANLSGLVYGPHLFLVSAGVTFLAWLILSKEKVVIEK